MALNVAKVKEKARKFEVKDQHEKAIGTYMSIIRELEDKPEMDSELALFNKVGDLYLKVGDVTAGIEMYEKAVNRYIEGGYPNNAIALCHKILRSAPGRTHVYLQLAQLTYGRGFVADAKKSFLEYAERMQQSGKIEEACEALKQFADISEDSAKIRQMLAEQLRAAAKTDEAKEDLERLAAGLEAEIERRRSRASVRASQIGEAVKEPASKGGDIVFLDLSEDTEEGEEGAAVTAVEEPPAAAPEEEAAASAAEEPAAEELDIVPTSLGEAATELELERFSGQFELDELPPGSDAEEAAAAVGELDVGATVEEIQTLDEEAPTLEEAVEAIDIEPTTLEPAEPPVAEEVLEVEEPQVLQEPTGEPEVIEAVGPVAEEILEVGEPEVLEQPTEEPEAVEAVAAGAPEMDVPELDLGSDESERMSGEISLADVGEVEIAAAVIEEAVAAPDVASLEAQVAENPEDLGKRQALGEALIQIGERERGTEELDQALEAYAEKEDWPHTLALVDEILRLDNNSVHYHQKRVEYAFRAGERRRLVDAYLGLADAFFRGGEMDRARAVYERVVEHDPENSQAASALETLGPAEAEAEEAAPTAPAEVAAEASGDFVNLGELIMADEEAVMDTRMRIEEEEPTGDEGRDFEGLLAQFKKGIEKNIGEEDAESHYDLGVAFKEMGLLDEAIAEFQKALRSPSGRLRASEALGGCFIEKGQHSVAATVLRRALETESGGDSLKIGVLYLVGRCEEEQGKPAEALVYYERVFAVDIGFQDVSERVKSLAEARG